MALQVDERSSDPLRTAVDFGHPKELQGSASASDRRLQESGTIDGLTDSTGSPPSRRQKSSDETAHIFSDTDHLDSPLTDFTSESESSKIQPVPVHLFNSILQSPERVQSSPRFNMRTASPWNQRPYRTTKSPRLQKLHYSTPREKRRRITEDLSSELHASVAALKLPEEGASSQSKLGASVLTPVKLQHQPSEEEKHKEHVPPPHSLSLWSYLMLELASQKTDKFHEEKTEQLLNFARVPVYLERVIIFGTLTCLDAFLHFFTILPLRFVYAIYLFFRNLAKGVKERLPTSRKGDIIKGLIFMLTLSLLLQLDTSKIYHNIRGQSAIKLYVMFNVLEIADKLFSALGQDILECLFSHETLNRNFREGFSSYYRPVIFAILGIIYVYFHSLVILYQIITLNVAVNSYSNALLTLLLSNQFSEIKSAVFKKFERENLFQLTCADITERFQLTTILFIIGMRNIVEVSNAGLVPRSWSGWDRWLGALLGPMVVVIGSEICVDWLKHAYIAKFNNLRPKVYRKFLDVLAYDYSENSFSDDIMTKRLGIPIFPLASVFFRMLLQCYFMLADHHAPRMSPLVSPLTPTPTTPLTNITSNVSSSLQYLTASTTTFPLNVLDDFLTTGKSMLTPYMPTISIGSDEFYLYLSLVLVTITAFLLLFALKLILGLFLLQYSHRRRAQILARPTSQLAPASKPHRASNAAQQQQQQQQQLPLPLQGGRPRTQSQSQSQSRGSATAATTTLTSGAAASGAASLTQSGYESDQSDHIPGPLKGGQGLIEIPKHLREKLYYPEEPVPPPKGRKSNIKEFRDLLSVRRFKMAAKQIW